MARRYYLSKIVGDGNPDGGEGAFRPKVADYGVNWVGVIPTGEDGKPTSDWALVMVNTANHSRLLEDPDIDALPDYPLDVQLSAMEAGLRTATLAKLQGRGGDNLKTSDSFRMLIRSVGKHLQSNFDENNFDVSE